MSGRILCGDLIYQPTMDLAGISTHNGLDFVQIPH